MPQTEQIQLALPSQADTPYEQTAQRRAQKAAWYRNRYHSDPEFRARRLATQAAATRVRYQNDPEFRARRLAACAASARRADGDAALAWLLQIWL